MDCSRNELKLYLAGIDVTYSDKLWKHIFLHMDKGHDNTIDIEEFMIFLFPENENIQVGSPLYGRVAAKSI